MIADGGRNKVAERREAKVASIVSAAWQLARDDRGPANQSGKMIDTGADHVQVEAGDRPHARGRPVGFEARCRPVFACWAYRLLPRVRAHLALRPDGNLTPSGIDFDVMIDGRSHNLQWRRAG